MTRALTFACAALLALAAGAAAADDHSHHHQPAPPARSGVRLPDLPLSTQAGQVLNFRRDILADKLVVVGFVYTNCTTVCPVVSGLFARLQERLGDRMESEVRLLSVSVDPVRDTPPRLAEYAARFHARPGWLWLTGPKANVDEVLKGLGTYTPDYTRHPAVILVGDPSRGVWSRLYGIPDTDDILAQLATLRSTTAALGG